MARFKIPSHVFGFGLVTAPTVMYGLYWKNNHKTDEEFEQILKEKYSRTIEGNRNKKQEMVSFFKEMKDQSPEQEEKLADVLQGGRSSIKRHYAIDKELYGTDEGVARSKKEKKEQKRQNLLKSVAKKGLTADVKASPNKSVGKISSKKEIRVSSEKIANNNNENESGLSEIRDNRSISSIGSIFAVGTLALVTGVLVGGRGAQHR